MALYLQVARALQDRIAAGEHPVGSLLPTEHSLADSFGVSRQTIRQAIGHLRAMKLLSARKGVGTRVEAARPHATYYQTLDALSDLFQFAADARYRVTATERVSIAGREAQAIGCKPGRAWLRLEGIRELPDAAGPLALTTVLIDARFAAIAEAPCVHTRALFAQIADRFGVGVAEVRQDIEAAALTEAEARRLDAPAGSPALLITRRFFGPGHGLLQLSRNLHPADRFRYSMTVRREG